MTKKRITKRRRASSRVPSDRPLGSTASRNRAVHTPGPWKWEAAPPGYLITTTVMMPEIVLAEVFDDEDGEPDVRLIAAAPDLLEALREMIYFFNWDIEADRERAHEAAEAAIAKAEGRPARKPRRS